MPISSDFVVTSRYPETVVPEKSLPDLILEHLQSYSKNETAFIYTPTNEEYTYGDICDLVQVLSAGLQHKYNLRKGDVVATCLTNCPEFLITMLAVLRLGAIVTTTNPAYTLEELEHQYHTTNPQFIVTEEELLPSVLTVASKLKGFRKVILARGHSPPGHVFIDNLENLINIGKTAPSPVLPVLDVKNDVACILFSSGTTGLPKGVLLTHSSMAANFWQSLNSREPPGYKTTLRGDVMFTVFPYFHMAGIHLGLMWPLIAGAKIVCTPKYHAEQFLSTIQKYRATTLILPPPILVFLAKSPLIFNYDLSSVRLIICGAAPVSREIAVEVQDRLRNLSYVVQLFGVTELSGLTHLVPLNEKAKEKLASVGTLLSSTSGRVAPAELEAVILTHPAVADVIVIGIPDTYAGELPRAFVVLKNGHSATEIQIQDHVKEHVASYKRLAGGVVFVDEVPKTATGKLLRRQLRQKVQTEFASQKSKL